MKKIELLAPAGDEEALKAAIMAGANAVYMGGSRFGARAFAGNFEDDKLIDAVDYAHQMGVKIYITANTIIKDEEIGDFLNYIDFLYEIGVDAVILQDLGMIDIISKRIPDLELHASTQMTASTAQDVLFLKELGVSRVVLSRELSYDEISAIKAETKVEVEAFVHGALCVSYSGKCLFSSMNGMRSGNRGMCAQPCREPYKATVENKPLLDKEYVFSTKDLNTLDILEDLIDAGIDSLKIEGRMKRSEYVFAVTSAYRQAIDNVIMKHEPSISSLDMNYSAVELDKVFNRDFTKGYIGQDKGSKIMNHKFQKYVGKPVAKVIEYDRKSKRLMLELLDTLTKGDGLNTGEFVGRILKKDTIVKSADKGEIVAIDSIKKFEPGFIVYKTFDKIFMDDISSRMSRVKKIPIKAFVEIRNNKYPTLILNDYKGNTGEYKLEEYTTTALNKPTTRESIIDQIQKMGDTPFFVDSIEVSVDENIFIPIKTLNLLRREAVSLLIESQSNSSKRVVESKSEFNPAKINHSKKSKKELKWSVLIHKQEQFEAAIKFNVDRVYVHGYKLYRLLSKKYPNKNIYYALPPVIKQSDISIIDKMLKSNSNIKVLHSSLGYIELQIFENVVLDYPLNLLNSFSHNLMHKKSCETTITPEMIFSIGGSLDYIDDMQMVEMPVYLYPKLMITEYCPHKNDAGVCKYKKCMLEHTQITSKQSEEYVLKKSINCKTILYPSKPKHININAVNNFIDKGFSKFRVELLNESYDETINILESYL
ncbi:putative protease [Acetoanaerobium noterae]|uniref:Putative protease n=1 Tax=Acetoanaerobium noterae TaxID=745369 RepID=A0A1T5C1H4_9FIRM|nr:U32 family peptidase [Acetoanaerobium noterae]SKB53482.1 putative protease [Acetoanaerobium noterae]